MARLASITPVRPIKLSRRSFTGRIAMDGGSATFESTLERDWLVVLDFDKTVAELREQPFTLIYDTPGGKRKYTPDVMAKFNTVTGKVDTIVYEVKPREELRANWARYECRFRAAIRHCKSQGWRFRIVTEREIRTPFLDNAKFLRRYRNLQRDSLFAGQLLYSLKALGETTPQALLAAAYWTTETKMAALPTLWKLLAEREICTDFNCSITMASPIWLGR